MTVENLLSQMGIGSKQFTERFAEYPAAAHDHHFYYAYEPPSHEHVTSSKHHYNGGGHKSNAALSALTLLAFLFFLHILQQCLKEHMTAMSTPQVMVVSAGRDGEQNIAKTPNKLDKTGFVNEATDGTNVESEVDIKSKISNKDNADFSSADNGDEIFMMKIETAEHTPHNVPKYQSKANTANSSSFYSEYMQEMEKN